MILEYLAADGFVPVRSILTSHPAGNFPAGCFFVHALT